MSTKKVKDVDSIYSGGSTKRSRIFDDISCSSSVRPARWTSILSCCWRRNREKKPASTLKEYNPNEWDYIVEKLVVKRVPISLFATEEDFRELVEGTNYKELSYGPLMGPAGKEMRDKQVYSATQGIDPTLHFLKSKPRGDLSNKPSSKNLRFNREEDLLDEDAAQAGPSSYGRDTSILRMREYEVANEYLNQFSSLHPDLKENERSPKDPHPLNPPRSERSLAENISEIAASTKKNPNAKSKKGKEKLKQGSNVYVTVSDTSREISTQFGEQDIPTRDNTVGKHAPLIRRKIGSTSCLPYTQKLPKTRKPIPPGIDSPHNQHKLSENSNDRDSKTKSVHKASQYRVHHVSCEQQSMNKVAKLKPRELDAGFTSQRKNDPELSKSAKDREFATEATSYTSDDVKNENLAAGTTLRWKIIIKHHQPTELETSESAANFTESSTLPRLHDGFHRSKLLNTESFDKIEKEDKMDYKNG